MKRFKLSLFAFIALGIFTLVSCDKDNEDTTPQTNTTENEEENTEENDNSSTDQDDDNNNSDAKDNNNVVIEDSIKSLSKTEGFAGFVITIEGENFSTVTTENEVSFNGTFAKVLTATATSLEVQVPESGTSGPVSIKVNNEKLANPQDFTYYELPDPIIYNVCDTGDQALKITNFHVTLIEKVNNNNLDFYSFRYQYTVINNSSKTIELPIITSQAYMSVDAKFGGDIAAGGAIQPPARTLAPGESTEFGYSANSGFWPDPLDIDGAYLLVQAKYKAPDCIDLIAQKIIMK